MEFAFRVDPSPDADDASGVLADALVRRGHVVRLVATDRPPGFRGGRLAEWVEEWSTGALAGAGVVIVEDDAYRDKPRGENTPLRVLLAGSTDVEPRGIEDGYGAIAHARWFHQKVDLIRSSPWAPSRGEPLDDVQEFHVGLDAAEMMRLLHTCDVVLVPSHAEAGLSLLAAEAMAAGIPCVLTDTPAHGLYAIGHFGPERNAVELGEKLIEVVSDEELRADLRSRGRAKAEEFRSELVAAKFERSHEGRG